MSWGWELEVEVHVIPHADDHDALPLLRHSIVSRIEQVVLHPVAQRTEILENHLEHSSLAEVHQSLHVLRKEEGRALGGDDTDQLLVEYIALVPDIALGVGHGEPLAGEAADDDVAVGDVLAPYFADVPADNMPPYVPFVCRDRV